MATVPDFDLILRRGRVDGEEGAVDIGIRDGWISASEAVIRGEGADELDLDGRLVSPAFADPHIHLDKVLVASLLPTNRSGTLSEAIRLLHQTKRKAEPAEVAERAGTIIRQAVISGTTMLRSHVDVDTIGGLRPLEGVAAARRQHEDICEIQIVAFPQEGIERDPGAAELMGAAMRSDADVVGGMPHWEETPEASRRHIEFCMDLADRHDADVDMHVDETDDPGSRTLEMLVEETRRRGWTGRVTAGHCCAMAAWEDDYAADLIERLAAAGINVVTLPATNLMLQGRDDTEPRRRGIPRVKELLAAGVQMGSGQDCVGDAFYPLGAADQLQVAMILAHVAQLSTNDELDSALKMVRGGAARLMGVTDHGIAPGCRADLVVLDASNQREALQWQASRRWVIKRGRVVAETRSESVCKRENGLLSGRRRDSFR